MAVFLPLIRLAYSTIQATKKPENNHFNCKTKKVLERAIIFFKKVKIKSLTKCIKLSQIIGQKL